MISPARQALICGIHSRLVRLCNSDLASIAVLAAGNLVVDLPDQAAQALRAIQAESIRLQGTDHEYRDVVEWCGELLAELPQ